MRRATVVMATAAFATLPVLGCILVTGSTDGYTKIPAEAAAGCDASLDAQAVPEAAVACVGCLRRSCSAAVTACESSCRCTEAVARLLGCLGAGRPTNDCTGEALAGGASSELLALGSCLQESGCSTSECTAPPPGGNADADADADAEADAEGTDGGDGGG